MVLNTVAVVFAQNHPSAVAERSQTDSRITDRLREALDLVGVKVLGHMVVGETIVSFVERGWI